jgi:hypothetical protein
MTMNIKSQLTKKPASICPMNFHALISATKSTVALSGIWKFEARRQRNFLMAITCRKRELARRMVLGSEIMRSATQPGMSRMFFEICVANRTTARRVFSIRSQRMKGVGPNHTSSNLKQARPNIYGGRQRRWVRAC